jgi:hypothetical protein
MKRVGRFPNALDVLIAEMELKLMSRDWSEESF